MGRYKKGVTKARAESTKAAATSRWHPSENQENIPPLQLQAQRSEERIKRQNTQIVRLERRMKKLQKDLKNTAAREKRRRAAEDRLRQQNKELKIQMREAERAAEWRIKNLLLANGQSVEAFEMKLRHADARLQAVLASNEKLTGMSEKDRARVQAMQRTIHNLKAIVRRGRKARRRRKERQGPALLIKNKHMYSRQLRTLVRQLVAGGCSLNKVGGILKEVASVFGVQLGRVISRRTVQRIVLEGLILARTQQGFELQHATDITMSGDSTSRRNINYQSHHVTYKVLERQADGTVRMSDTSKSSFYGIRSTVDHSTAMSFDSWHRVWMEATDFYNGSPLFRRLGKKRLTIRRIMRFVRGMCSDHANGEKATADAIRDFKHKETLEDLGEARRDEMTVEDFEALVADWNEQKLQAVGGREAWEALPKEDQAVRDLATVSAMMQSLGTQALAELPDAERRLLNLFVWTGCCMHKDQNSFKGGNTAMMATWSALGLTPPIPLANKANAEAVRKAVAPETGSGPLTPEQVAALEASTRGGVKTTAPAGMIFNNHLDKRGQGDTHMIIMGHKLKAPMPRFPSTSNTRFGSFGEAAGELLAHLHPYIEFLEFIRDKKDSATWTNVEKNVYNALHDDATLTELAVLALYSQLITHPYMRHVRAPESVALNAIDLGPLHADICAHCQRLIDNPDLILSFEDSSYLDATFDGEDFERPDVVAAVQDLAEAERLPHLREMFVSFLKGARVTWLRFSSEYAPGGIIDGLSADERSHVFLNATNDRNEGALGSWCVWSRTHPTSSMHAHNSLAMFMRNRTQQFIDDFCNDDDDVWAMREARRYDESGVERKRRAEQAEFELRTVEMKRQRQVERVDKKNARLARLSEVRIIESVQEINASLTGKSMVDQYSKLRALWGSRLKPVKGWATMDVKTKRIEFKALFEQHVALLEAGEAQASLLPISPAPEMVEITQAAWEEEEDEVMAD
ncbi:hypothetical protein K525DRAFT_211091 [Schizophyllum commune Loenen D]|nr:hypothetical protein K525DRAFT_211091 [Schizophyllum commune Loenen D]